LNPSDQVRSDNRYPPRNYVDFSHTDVHRNAHQCFLNLMSQISAILSPLIILFKTLSQGFNLPKVDISHCKSTHKRI